MQAHHYGADNIIRSRTETTAGDNTASDRGGIKENILARTCNLK